MAVRVPITGWYVSGRPGAGPVWRGRLWASSLVIVLAVIVSFLPTAVLNFYYCGDWSGLALERPGMAMKNPFVGIWGNAFLLLLDNLVPPFFPAAGWWNQNWLTILPHSISAPLVSYFEAGSHTLWELPAEDWSGIGFGVSWLAVITVIASWGRRGAGAGRGRAGSVLSSSSSSRLPDRERNGGGAATFALNPFNSKDAADVAVRAPCLGPLSHSLRFWVLLAPWLALLGYCMESGMSTGARLISPYYPLLLPLVLAGERQGEIVRTRWFRTLACAVVALSFPVLTLTPARPLWPAQTILSKLTSMKSGNRLLERARKVYAVYAGRADPMANIRALLPPDIERVGFFARGDDTDISLWRPLGQRQVEHVLVNDSAAELRQRRIQYIVAGEYNFSLHDTTFEAWRQQIGAELVAKATATIRAAEPPQTWYVVKLPP